MFITLPLVDVRSIVMSVVCLSVCMSTYMSERRHVQTLLNFLYMLLFPWLDLLMTIQYVTYFWFCG